LVPRGSGKVWNERPTVSTAYEVDCQRRRLGTLASFSDDDLQLHGSKWQYLSIPSGQSDAYNRNLTVEHPDQSRPNSRRRPVRELKTKKTTASVQAFLTKAAKGERYEACQFLLATFEKATTDKAAMWGSVIVGVGAETVTYANGDRLEWPIGGFSPRAQNIAIYGMKASPRLAALMKKIGKAKMGGGCLYIKSLEGVDQRVLGELIATAMQAKVQRYQSRSWSADARKLCQIRRDRRGQRRPPSPSRSRLRSHHPPHQMTDWRVAASVANPARQ
jgi:hypothetical protein